MKIIELVQGSPEWHAHRANHFNASDAPAMLGCSPYTTRTELLHKMATGAEKEIDASLQRRFDDGHRFEALARPLAESIISEDLFPVTGTEGKLSASFDGLTMMNDIAFEHKSLNAELRKIMTEGCSGSDLPKHYQVQMEQQHMVSGCEKILFMASKWSGDSLVEVFHCWYYPNANLRDEIAQGWALFACDLQDYQHTEAQPEAVGRAPESLPALRIEVTGMVTNSNLEAFKAGAAMMFSKINRVLETDQDFADAEKTVKHCKEIEDNIEAAKKHALSQTASIDELYRTLDSVSAEARAVRLELDKLVKARKENLRIEIQQEAEMAFRAHIDTINARLNTVQLPPIKADFAGAMKGKKTVASLRDACDTELARVKIEASQLSEHIGSNLDFCSRVIRAEEKHLFHDLSGLVLKPQADMEAIIKMRIKEESDRIDAAAAAKIEAEKSAQERANAAAAAKIEPDRQAGIRAQMREQEASEGMPQNTAEIPVIGTLPPQQAAQTPAQEREPIRPSADYLIGVIAREFDVSRRQAREWLSTTNFNESEVA